MLRRFPDPHEAVISQHYLQLLILPICTVLCGCPAENSRFSNVLAEQERKCIEGSVGDLPYSSVGNCLRQARIAGSSEQAEKYFREGVSKGEVTSQLRLAALLLLERDGSEHHLEAVRLASELIDDDYAFLGRANLIVGVAALRGVVLESTDDKVGVARDHLMTSASRGNYMAAAVLICRSEELLDGSEYWEEILSALFRLTARDHILEGYTLSDAKLYAAETLKVDGCGQDAH